MVDFRTVQDIVWIISIATAVGIAVAMQPAFRERGLERIGVVLCGGNLDLDALPSLLAGD